MEEPLATAPQAVPQLPQFAGSELVIVQIPEQAALPEAHSVDTAPCVAAYWIITSASAGDGFGAQFAG
jgi:hypothetical protein